MNNSQKKSKTTPCKKDDYDCIVDIIITDPGDESVGIFSQTWVIEDVTMVPQLREELRRATAEYFEYYIAAEKCQVLFSDEIEKEVYEPKENKDE